jgi:hypothetical protein
MLVIPYLPACNVVVRVGFVVAERVLYIPSSGWCLLFAIGLSIIIKYQKVMTIIAVSKFMMITMSLI